MADRVLAKHGPGHGPWVCVRNIRKPKVRVRGLNDGKLYLLRASSTSEGSEVLMSDIACDGLHEVDPLDFMKVVADTNSKSLLVFIEGE